MDPIEGEGAVVGISGLGEVAAGEVGFAETEDDVVDDVKGDFQVALLLPLHQ